MSTANRDKSYTVWEQRSINCADFKGWEVNAFLILRAVRLISCVWSARRREPLLKCRSIHEVVVSSSISSPTFLLWWCSLDLLTCRAVSWWLQKVSLPQCTRHCSRGGKASKRLLRTSFSSECNPSFLLQHFIPLLLEQVFWDCNVEDVCFHSSLQHLFPSAIPVACPSACEALELVPFSCNTFIQVTISYGPSAIRVPASAVRS